MVSQQSFDRYSGAISTVYVAAWSYHCVEEYTTVKSLPPHFQRKGGTGREKRVRHVRPRGRPRRHGSAGIKEPEQPRLQVQALTM